MILMSQIFNVIANENVRYKCNELESLIIYDDFSFCVNSCKDRDTKIKWLPMISNVRSIEKSCKYRNGGGGLAKIKPLE